MNAHVDYQRGVMFAESAEAAQKRLEALVKQVEAMMSKRVMEVFVAMRRDYRSVLGGVEETQGELLPKAERLMRKELIRILGDIERIFTDVLDGKVGESACLEEEEEQVKKEMSSSDEFETSSISDKIFSSWMDEGTNLNDRSPNPHVPASSAEEDVCLADAERSIAFSANDSHSRSAPPRDHLETQQSPPLAELSPPCLKVPSHLLQKDNADAPRRNLATYYETEDETKYQPSSHSSRDSTPAYT